MPVVLKTIHEIAREKQRDVMYLSFSDSKEMEINDDIIV